MIVTKDIDDEHLIRLIGVYGKELQRRGIFRKDQVRILMVLLDSAADTFIEKEERARISTAGTPPS